MYEATLEKYRQLKTIGLLLLIVIANSNYAYSQIAESFTSTTFAPTGWITSGWTRSTTAADLVSAPAAAICGSTNGTLTTSAIANPQTLTFYLGRSTNTTAKTLNINVSTTSQTTGFTTIATYDHSNVPSGSYNQYTVDLSAYSSFGTVYIQFQKVSTTTSPWRLDDVNVTINTGTPTIVLSPTTLTGLDYSFGNGPSQEQTFTCSGSNLTADITLAAPADYEISTTSGIGFTNSITLTQTAGTVSLTTIYVRLISGLAVGIYNLETITASSTGATDRTVICNGEVVPNGFVINEIMVRPNSVNDGTNAPNTAEWIEFYNGTGSTIDISCWFFTDGDFSVTFPSGTIVAAGGYITVASAAGSGLSPTIDWTTCGCSAGGAQIGIFTNSGEQVLLYNSSGTLIDAVIWSGGQLPDGMTTSTVGSCSSVTVTFPSTGSSYEDIGLIGSGVSNERDSDGSSTWQQTTTNTFGYSNATPLPIELLSFTATPNNKNVDLLWQTATEINNDFFTIERSKDGEHFITLKVLDGAGNSNSLINYYNQDTDPLDGISYYRLKQTDFDGNFSYSNIVSVNFNSNGIIVESIFPNPAQNEITISLNNNQACTVSIYNMLGERVFQEKFNENNIHINIQDIANGVYSIAISDTEKTELLKFIKQ